MLDMGKNSFRRQEKQLQKRGGFKMCKICKSYFDPNGREKHVENVHNLNKVTVFICEICDEVDLIEDQVNHGDQLCRRVSVIKKVILSSFHSNETIAFLLHVCD